MVALGYTLHVQQDALVLEQPLHQSSGSCLRVCDAEEEGQGRKLQLKIEGRSSTLAAAARAIPVKAVLGFVNLHRGWYLGVVTRAHDVVRQGPRGSSIKQALAVDWFLVPRDASSKPRKELTTLEQSQERKFLEMLDTVTETGTLYFAHDYDVTQTAQRIALLQGKHNPALEKGTSGLWLQVEQVPENGLTFASQASRADPRFFWNSRMVKPFQDAGAEEWVHPFMCGYVSETQIKSGADDQHLLNYIFIARRSRDRQGTRFNRRGLNRAGNVANFVEIEQIFLPQAIKDTSARDDIALSSYVQTRGSIPLFWTQLVSIKYMPRVELTQPVDETLEAFKMHFYGQHSVDNYGKVTAVNLIDRTGSSRTVQDQNMLGSGYQKLAEKLGDGRLKYEWFDFHHECRKGRYDKLSMLLDRVKEDWEASGAFVQLRNDEVLSWQNGVIRTNCMDNLDRTNVVQSIFARQHMISVIEMLKDKEGTVPTFKVQGEHLHTSPHSAFETTFLSRWRDNANVMSVLYAGTPALKTRTGALGKVQDGLNSVTRYFLNNFMDGNKQDALDLFLGNFNPSSIQPGTDIFTRGPTEKTLFSVLEKAAMFYLAVLVLSFVFYSSSAISNFGFSLLVCLTCAAVGAHHVLRHGYAGELVNRPKLVAA